MYQLILTKSTIKDADKLSQAGLKQKTQILLNIIKINPYKNPPPYKKLIGDLSGAYSRRINIKHRLVYQILEEKKIVKVLAMWSHYE